MARLSQRKEQGTMAVVPERKSGPARLGAKRGTVVGKRVATGTAGRAPVELAGQEKPLKKAAVIKVDVKG